MKQSILHFQEKRLKFLREYNFTAFLKYLIDKMLKAHQKVTILFRLEGYNV